MRTTITGHHIIEIAVPSVAWWEEAAWWATRAAMFLVPAPIVCRHLGMWWVNHLTEHHPEGLVLLDGHRHGGSALVDDLAALPRSRVFTVETVPG